MVYTALAIDASSSNNSVTYSLANSADEALFGLSGDELRFIRCPNTDNPRDLNTDNVYEVELVASDELSNGYEARNGLNPLDASDRDADPDSNGGGIPDARVPKLNTAPIFRLLFPDKS